MQPVLTHVGFVVKMIPTIGLKLKMEAKSHVHGLKQTQNVKISGVEILTLRSRLGKMVT